MSRLEGLKSVSEAYKRSASKKAVPERTRWHWVRDAIGVAQNAAHIVSALALVVIGYLTYEVSRRSAVATESDVSQRQQLLIEISDLRDERAELSSEVGSLRALVADAERQLGRTQDENRSASVELASREERIEALNNQVSAAEQQTVALITENVRSSMALHLTLTFHDDALSGYRMSEFDFVGFDGQPVPTKRPIEFFYPRTRDEQWAFIVQSGREWLRHAKADDELIAQEMWRVFVEECQPSATLDRFSFLEPYPAFEEFETTGQLIKMYGGLIPANVYEDWQRRYEEAGKKAKDAREREASFVRRFNTKKAEYMMSIEDEVLGCQYAPTAKDWLEHRGDESRARTANVGKYLALDDLELRSLIIREE